MSYCRVTSEDRLRIKDGLEAGLTKSAIADKLGFNKSTIGREISRNRGLKGTLELKWSPEQISNRLRVEGHETVSAETIYKLFTRIEKMMANFGVICAGLIEPERSVFPLKIVAERSKMQDPYRSVQRRQINEKNLVIGNEI